MRYHEIISAEPVVLEEGVNDYFLFHATFPEKAEKILQANRMLPKTTHTRAAWRGRFPKKAVDQYGEVAGTSLTRSIGYARQWVSGEGVVFVLDARALRSRTRVVPIDFFDVDTYNRRSESEEFAVGGVKNIEQCLVAILISQTIYNDITDYMQDSKLANHPKLKIVGRKWDGDGKIHGDEPKRK